MRNVETIVTFVDRTDIISLKRNSPIEEIDIYDLKDHDIYMKSHILILNWDGKYKVLKSRY